MARTAGHESCSCWSKLAYYIHVGLKHLPSTLRFQCQRHQGPLARHATMRRIQLTTLFEVENTNHHFETSWLLPPVLLSGLRSLIALYIFTSIFFFWGWYGTHENTPAIGQSFSFFTWLTYWGIGFYMLFAAIHTGYYARTGHSLLDRWPRALRILHSLLYSSVTTYPFLVTIVFWVLLFRPPWYTKTFTGWQNV